MLELSGVHTGTISGNGTLTVGGGTEVRGNTTDFSGTVRVLPGRATVRRGIISGIAQIETGATATLNMVNEPRDIGFGLRGTGRFHFAGPTSSATTVLRQDEQFQGTLRVLSGNLRMNTLNMRGSLEIDAGGTFTYAQSVGGNVVRPVTGNGTLAHVGGGTITYESGALAGFSGQLAVNEGPVRLENSTYSGAIVLRQQGTLLLDRAHALGFKNSLSTPGTLGGSVVKTGAAAITPADFLNVSGNLTNSGVIQFIGGRLEVSETFSNASGGQLSERGLIQTALSGSGTGLSNSGSLAFSGGFTDVFGDVINNSGGRLISAGGGVVTYHDDVTHNALEIQTMQGAQTVILGALTGSGDFTGTGTVELVGDIRPGNSPGFVPFGGDLALSSSSQLRIELGGRQRGTQYDSLQVTGQAFLGGSLHVAVFDGFTPQMGDSFLVLEGLKTGQF